MKFQVMDATGHSEEAFDLGDKVSNKAAKARFDELTKGKGYFAAALSGDGSPGKQLKVFDPEAETVVFRPALQGG